MNADLKRALQRVPDVATERYERVWQAIVERTVSDNQKNCVRVSALIDGELPETERAEVQKFLAGDPELARNTTVWKKLAAATAALPVPRISEAAARQTALRISQRTQAAADQARKMNEAVGGAAKTPEISSERWQKVWQGIEGRVQKKTGEPASRAVPISTAPVRKITPIRRWRWVLAATAAAAVIALVALMNFNEPVEQTETVAAVTKLPNALDDRYESSLEFVNGKSVVCFYLKPQSSGDSGADSRWLPD